ncbi:ABC transporter permease [Parapedobacter sp. DT-150]|uniref:ABC transporter permease n=1 Tax=Parapedobacter sp. DT-150 TaxID=3396162 RepID=UPI003F19C7FA
MITNHLKTAWRTLLRQRKTTLINLSGLAIGMTAAFFVFLWVKNEYAYNGYHQDAERIYRLKTYLTIDQNNTWVWENSPYLLGEEAKKQLPELEALTRIRAMRFDTPTIAVDGQRLKEKAAAQVDEQWFGMFDYDFVEGSAKAFNSHLHSVILTESNARRYFGKGSAVGKTLRIDSIDHQVQGVIKDFPTNSNFRYHMYLPIAARLSDPNASRTDLGWGNFGYRTFVKIAATANPVSVAGKLHGILASHRDKKKDDVQIGLIGLMDMHFEDDLQSSSFQHGNLKTTKVFMILGGILLAIACINYVNLTTARASLRAKEVGIKKIVGAGRIDLFKQFIVEAMVTSCLALCCTLLLSWICLPFFNQLVDNHFVLSLTDRTLWQLLGGTLLVSTLLTGIYPALLLSSFRPVTVFRGENILGMQDSALRKSLVVVQFVISIVLMIGTIVIYRQMQYIQTQHASYDHSQVMTLNVPWQYWAADFRAGRTDIRDVLRQKLSAESSVERISVMNGGSVVNMDDNASGGFDWDGRAADFDPPIVPFDVDTNFMALANLQLVEGRWFTPHSQADERNVVLNETAVRELGIRQPIIGQRFVNRSDTGVIIGVVQDFVYKSMHEPIGAAVLSNDPGSSSTFLVKTAAGRHTEAHEAAARIWKELMPDTPFEYQFADEEFDALYRADRKTASLILVFSALAIFIACLGLYGLAAFSTERRHKEIGIRKVLGATVSGMVGLLSKDFVKLVLVAVVIASPIAWWIMNKWLADFAYRIDIQWWMFAGAGLVAVVIALATVSWQAVRAAVANPVDSLRDE